MPKLADLSDPLQDLLGYDFNSPVADFTLGFGDDVEYVYYHPDTPEGRNLQMQGYDLPSPDQYTYPPSNQRPAVFPPFPVKRSLSDHFPDVQWRSRTASTPVNSALPLSKNLANIVSSDTHDGMSDCCSVDDSSSEETKRGKETAGCVLGEITGVCRDPFDSFIP